MSLLAYHYAPNEKLTYRKTYKYMILKIPSNNYYTKDSKLQEMF